MNVLEGLPGGLPNVHIAVVSSDMGAGSVTNGCSGNGRPASSRTAELRSRGNALRDHPAERRAVHLEHQRHRQLHRRHRSTCSRCIAALGEDGCGFEQQLLSVTHALGADNFDATGRPQPPQENEGFLRDDAYLAIIFITNEDDCSAPGRRGERHLTRTSTGDNLMSKLGPPTGYRCNRYGHCAVDGGPPPMDSPIGAADPGDFDDRRRSCRTASSAENTGPLKDDAQLLHRQDVRRGHQGAQARSREPDPGRGHRGPLRTGQIRTPTRSPGRSRCRTTRAGPGRRWCTPASRRATIASPIPASASASG